MTTLLRSRALVTAVSAALALASCSGLPRVKTQGIQSREVLVVSASIAERTATRSGAMTRAEASKAGASAGASGTAEAWFESGELGLWVLLLAPVVIPVTIVVGGGVGAAAGAASGTSMTRDQIERAVTLVSDGFRPWEAEAQLQAQLEQSIKGTYLAESPTCVTNDQKRSGCPRSPRTARIRFNTSFQLAPSSSRARSGYVDFVGHITMSADPRGLMKPDCVTWTIRRPAGNLAGLARQGHAGIMGKFNEMIADVAAQAPAALLADNHEPSGEGWKRVDCRLWERALAKT